MSVNPVVGSGLPSNLAAIIAEELAALAGDAQTLAGRLNAGDVVQAVVLPPNGLTDLLAIGGLRVAAELPPTLVPGETITVEVSGFTGDRINLQILPNAHPAPTLPAAADSSAAAARAANPPVQLPATPAPVSAAPAPAAAVVVAAAETPVRAATPPPLATVTAARPGRPLPVGLGSIEARIATSRATLPPTSAPNASRAPISLAPSIALRSSIAQRPALLTPAAPAAEPVGTPPAPRGPVAYATPPALLRALGLPVTPGNVSMAQLALTSPQNLPKVLQTLEGALPGGGGPQIATLRTLIAFVARIQPDSPVLATQVAAFVDQLVVGREGKLAGLLLAQAQTAGEPAPPVPAAAAPGLPAVALVSNVTAPALTDPAALAAERVAYHQTALDYDLKTTLIAVAGNSAEAAGSATPNNAALAPALDAALTAVTALQVNAAVALAAHPDGFAFALPLALPSGFAQARVRIDRDAPAGAHVPLDGDNFHIGFVLETQHLGLVAIDLVTVGRTVTVGVQTEASRAQSVFARSMHALTERLESQRYRVVKADCAVAARGPEANLSDPAPGVAADRSGLVDVDA